MKIDQALPLLKYFDAVAQTGSFTLAGERLCISQSTVSTQVKKLEQRLDTQLLIRKNKHQFSLTPEGKKLAEKTAQSLATLQATLDSLQTPAEHSTYTIACSASIGTYVLLPAMKKLKNRYPELSIHLVETSSSKQFFEDGIDLATNFGRPTSGYFSMPIGEVKKHLVASNDYLLSHRLPITMDNLADHQLIIQRHSKSDWPLLFEKNTLMLEGVSHLYVSNNQTKLEAVKMGFGVAVLPHYLLGEHLEGIKPVKGIDTETLSETLYFVGEKRRQNDPKIKWLLDALLDSVQLVEQ